MENNAQQAELSEWEQEEQVSIDSETKIDPVVDAARVVQLSPDVREIALATYRNYAVTLVVTADNVVAVAEFVKQCKLAAANTEAERISRTGPLNEKIKALNNQYMPTHQTFLGMAQAASEKINQYIEEQRREAMRIQQEAAAEAARQQAILDAKAEEARQAALRAESEGKDVKAATLHGKADILEQRAATVVAEQVAIPTGKIKLGNYTASFGGGKKAWSLPGWDKKKALRLTDPLLAAMVGDLTKLPASVQFLIRHADLNSVHLNASYKANEKFPSPFTEVVDYTKSTVR